MNLFSPVNVIHYQQTLIWHINQSIVTGSEKIYKNIFYETTFE